MQTETDYKKIAWSSETVGDVLEKLDLAELGRLAKQRKLAIKPPGKGTSSETRVRLNVLPSLCSH